MTVMMAMALMGFITSCASTNGTTAGGHKAGFLHGYYDKLRPGQTSDDPKLMWIKPGVDYAKYNKVMVDYVVFAFAEDSEYKGIDANEMKTLADRASLALVRALEKKMPVVYKAGPDVLRVRAAIVDLKQNHPGVSAVTTVVPAGLAISVVKRGASGSWAGAGGTTAEMMIIDSMTNEVIAAGRDQKASGFTERFSKWGSVEDAFAFWGERLATRLDNFTKQK